MASRNAPLVTRIAASNLSSALTGLVQAWGEVMTALDDMEQAAEQVGGKTEERLVGNIFAQDYPFAGSFDDLGVDVDTWAEAVRNVLADRYF
jgi:hypothetical protein